MKKIYKLLSILMLCLLFFSCSTIGSSEKKLTLESVQEEISITEGKSKNTWNLRDEANFEVEVFDGVYWVPANALGKTQYTNEQIAKMVYANPQIKQQLVNNLYEAIQLFQISGFEGGNDNVRFSANDIRWEHHKPGYYAITTNNGCCATNSNWLNYLLNGKYDELGFLQMNNENGSGHVINYIKQDGYYYFIDLTHYRNDNKHSSPENGSLDSYYKVDFLQGNIHKTDDPIKYVNYFRSINWERVLYLIYSNKEVANMGSYQTASNKTVLCFDSSLRSKTKILYNDSSDKLDFVFENDNSQKSSWSHSKKVPFNITTDFEVDEKPIIPIYKHVYLMVEQKKVPQGSGFGTGRNNLTTAYVYVEDQICEDFSIEVIDSVGEYNKKSDGRIEFRETKQGRSKVNITIDGLVYHFFWKGN